MDRIIKISEEIKRELGIIIHDEMNDPRLPTLTSVTRVSATKDLKFAKVYVSMLGTADEKKEALDVLTKAAGFLRSQLSQKAILRTTPELHFALDDSIEKGIYMSKLIDDTIKHDEVAHTGEHSDE
jgi:ribosome-binding factor A